MRSALAAVAIVGDAHRRLPAGWASLILGKIYQKAIRKIWLKNHQIVMLALAAPLGYHGVTTCGRTAPCCCSARWRGATAARRRRGWLRAETLESLLELNELCLELLAEQAAQSACAGERAAAAARWASYGVRSMPAARRRAAACPYLLLDAGFADPLAGGGQRPRRWATPPARATRPSSPCPAAPELAPPGVHLRLAPGALQACRRAAAPRHASALRAAASRSARCGQMHALAEAHPELAEAALAHPRGALARAAGGGGRRARRVRSSSAQMRGLTLLAAELRTATAAWAARFPQE